jgi:hypothetical protein
MAEIMVFVDDAVRGTLPQVCVKDGVPTADHMVVREELGGGTGLGVAWLLLLAGPLGWLGLLVIAAMKGSRGEVLTVQLPLSETAYQRILAARSLRRRSLGLGVAGGAVLLLSLRGIGSPAMLALAGVAFVATLMAIGLLLLAERRLATQRVGVDLDASRRWVRLSNVHPTFAAACLATEQHQRT